MHVFFHLKISLDVKMMLISSSLKKGNFQPDRQLQVRQPEETWLTKPEGRPEMQPWTSTPGVQPVRRPESRRTSQPPPSLITGNLELTEERTNGVSTK